MKLPQSLDILLLKLQIPAQNLASLSFCDSGRDGSAKWVQSLPLTQIHYVSGLLYKALPELSRLQTSVNNRINLLETLRTPSSQVIEGLARGFLNQPLILPEDTIKTATVVQALQKHLNTGYLVAIRDLCTESTPKKPQITLCLHRALTGMGLLLYRYYQLYLPVPDKLWSDIHCLYQIAEYFDLLAEPVNETLNHHQLCNTIKLAYTRILLLASCRPNQLRQIEIIATYEALNGLTQVAQLNPNNGKNAQENLICAALDSNQPPNYRSRMEDLGYSHLVTLNTQNVIKKLEAADEKVSEEEPSKFSGFKLTHALTQHLIQAWTTPALRSLDRQPTAGTLNITVGITSIHYHLAGGVHFSDFLDKAHSQPSASGIGSLLQSRYAPMPESKLKPGVGKAPAYPMDELDELDMPAPEALAQVEEEAHPIFKIPLIDTSPGGYCVEWRDAIPNQVKAGELLGLLDPVRNYWSLGVVRWANLSQGATQLGIQILATKAMPIAIAMVQPSGGTTEFLRGLEIPVLPAMQQPATIITNSVSFREQSRARVFRRPAHNDTAASDENIQLLKRCFATGVFNQFTYQSLSPNAPKPTEKPMLFDPEWDA